MLLLRIVVLVYFYSIYFTTTVALVIVGDMLACSCSFCSHAAYIVNDRVVEDPFRAIPQHLSIKAYPQSTTL